MENPKFGWVDREWIKERFKNWKKSREDKIKGNSIL